MDFQYLRSRALVRPCILNMTNWHRLILTLLRRAEIACQAATRKLTHEQQLTVTFIKKRRCAFQAACFCTRIK